MLEHTADVNSSQFMPLYGHSGVAAVTGLTGFGYLGPLELRSLAAAVLCNVAGGLWQAESNNFPCRVCCSEVPISLLFDDQIRNMYMSMKKPP